MAMLLATACADQSRRPAPTRLAADCYDAWPYVYYAPYDCWHGVWYGPTYFYEPYRSYYSATPAGRLERIGPGSRRAELPIPGERPDLPLPVPSLPDPFRR